MNYTDVTSSNIKAIAYDPSTLTLGVIFHTGKEYHYIGVTPDMFQDFSNAESKGKFLAVSIKPNPYLTVKLQNP